MAVSGLAGLLLSAALAGFAAPAAVAAGSSTCEWRAPAHDPFMGDVPGAVDDYADIPLRTRARLKARLEKRDYDDVVSIRRDSIEGGFRYEPALTHMHFGERRICGQVTRNTWQPDHEERALAYCEDRYCIVVPLACRNVSRVIRRPTASTTGTGAAPHEPLAFDAPAAGRPALDDPGSPTAHTLLAPPPTSQVPPIADLPPLPALPIAGPLPSRPPVVVTPPGIPPLPPRPPVPEPSTALLWAVGLVITLAAARSRTGRWPPLRPR